MNTEESKSKLEETKNNTKEQVERKETISYCSEESPSFIHGDEHAVKEENFLREDNIEEDVDHPSNTENSSEDTENELNPTHNDRATRIRMEQLELLVLIIDNVHSCAPLVEILTLSAGSAAIPTPAGIAEFFSPLDELDGLFVDDVLLFVVSVLAECMRAGNETVEEVVWHRRETNTAKDNHDEVSEEIDDSDDEENRAHTEGHVTRTTTALSGAALLDRSLVITNVIRVETSDMDFSDTKEEVSDNANNHEDTDDDENSNEGGDKTLESADRTAPGEIGDIVLVPEEEEGEDDDGKHTDEAVCDDPECGHGYATIYRSVGNIEGKQQHAALTNDETNSHNHLRWYGVGGLELILIVNNDKCIDHCHGNGGNAHNNHEDNIYHLDCLLTPSRKKHAQYTSTLHRKHFKKK